MVVVFAAVVDDDVVSLLHAATPSASPTVTTGDSDSLGVHGPHRSTVVRDGGDAVLASRLVIDAAVPGFLPSTHGLRFKNDWPAAAAFRIDVLGLQVPVGDARRGLCGGMVFAVRDLFLLGRAVPPDTVAPGSGPLYEYIGRRLKDSFTPAEGTRSLPRPDGCSGR